MKPSHWEKKALEKGHPPPYGTVVLTVVFTVVFTVVLTIVLTAVLTVVLTTVLTVVITVVLTVVLTLLVAPRVAKVRSKKAKESAFRPIAARLLRNAKQYFVVATSFPADERRMPSWFYS